MKDYSSDQDFSVKDQDKDYTAENGAENWMKKYGGAGASRSGEREKEMWAASGNFHRSHSMASEAICKWKIFWCAPHFSLVPPHEGAQRLFVTDWETIEVSPSVGSAVCTSTSEVGRGAIKVMGPRNWSLCVEAVL